MSDLTIVIPAYNEAVALKENLPALIEFCKAQSFQLIIVNDGSKDDTLSVLKEYELEPCFKIIHHKVNRGYGGAIKSGIRQVETKYCITIDADGQHRLEDVVMVYKRAVKEDADMVVGSRRGVKDASIYRGIGKRLIRMFAKMLMPVHIFDINSGMKLYDSQLAKKYIKLCPDNMSFSDTITLVFISQRHLVTEQDITVLDRTSGESTINTMTALDTVRAILNIVILFNPMRVFFPIAGITILASLSWAIPIILRGRGLSTGALLGLTTGAVFFLLGLLAEQLSNLRKVAILDD